MTSTILNVAWYGFKLSFGLFSLASVWGTAVVKNGALWAKDTEEEKQELAIAQKNFWSLDQQPLSGFKHAFFKTSSGTRIHYIVNESAKTSSSKDVAIFIHGFPDSFVLWRHILQSPELTRNHLLIAVDIPGYGGSDSLPAYGPYEVLEALAEFTVGVRKLYLQEGRRVVVVTHDWGAIIGARLAAEAGVLADHWIITSGLLPGLTAANLAAKTTLFKQMSRTWTRSPFNIRLLKNALYALGPIVSQFKRSFYIFCFQLPRPFTNVFGTFGNYWFLRVLHSIGTGRPKKGENILKRLSPKEAGESMAITTGPGPAQLESTLDGDGDRYGESVRLRSKDRGMFEKTRIYREGLFNDPWEKSLEITAALYELTPDTRSSSSGSLLANTAPTGALKAPATILLGEHDPAFDRRLALENARDYLVKGSQVVLIKGVGHWLPLEPVGRRVLEKTLLWALQDPSRGQETESTPFTAMSDVRVVEAM